MKDAEIVCVHKYNENLANNMLIELLFNDKAFIIIPPTGVEARFNTIEEVQAFLLGYQNHYQYWDEKENDK